MALGAQTTPVVAIGNKWVGGAAFDRLDEFFATAGASGVSSAEDSTVGTAVGNVFSESEQGIILDEDTLMVRLETLLNKTIAGIDRALPALLDRPLPVRGNEGRTVRGLMYHIAQVARDPLRAADRIPIIKAMHEYDPPDDLRTPRDLAGLTDQVLTQLREWWAAAPETTHLGVVDYYQGPYTFHGLLERCTWHVATHLRQLAWMLEDAGIKSDAGLTAEDTYGLPIPPTVWS